MSIEMPFQLTRITMKILIAIYCVIFLHHSVSGLTIDAQSAADKCFRKECKSTFLLKHGEIPMCGSDDKPYIHPPSFHCAKRCASKYGLELTLAHYGYCEGKPPGNEYWKDLMKH